MKVGDKLQISTDYTSPTIYIVRKVEGNYFYVSTESDPTVFSKIELKNNSYKVIGQNTQKLVYHISIIEPMGFEDIGIDSNRDILLNLDYDSLINMCKTNKYFQKICSNDDFWKMKTKRDFPNSVKYFTGANWKQYYVENHTWKMKTERDFPKAVIYFTGANWKQYYMEIRKLDQKKDEPYLDITLNDAITSHNFEKADYIFDTYGKILDKSFDNIYIGLEYYIESDDFEAFKYMVDKYEVDLSKKAYANMLLADADDKFKNYQK